MALNTNGLLPLLTPDYPGLDLNANQGPKIIAVSAILIAISTIAVILRFMSRMVSKAGLWWDDWLIVAAMVRYARGWLFWEQWRLMMDTAYVLGGMHLHDSQYVIWFPSGNYSALYLTSSTGTGYGFGKHMTAEGDLKARLEVAYHWFKLL